MGEKSTDVQISVIMGVYNQWNRDELKISIDSILEQSFADFEFIIYDDGSCEGEAAYLASLAMQDERIKLIRRAENNGLAFSLNTCLGYARGKYVARMDADDISKPERFLLQKEFLDEHPEYDWVGCNAELIDRHGVWGYRKMPEIPKNEDFLRFSPYIHPSVMYRKKVLEDIGGYNVSRDTLRCEDYEIFMRMHQAGYRGYNIQDYLFQYREHRSAYQKRKFVFRIAETKLRYRNFKEMKLLTPKGLLYVIRPLIGGLVPNRLILLLKHREAEQELIHIGESGEKGGRVPENIKKMPGTLQSND